MCPSSLDEWIDETSTHLVEHLDSYPGKESFVILIPQYISEENDEQDILLASGFISEKFASEGHGDWSVACEDGVLTLERLENV